MPEHWDHLAVVSAWLLALGVALGNTGRHAQRVQYYRRFLAYVAARGTPGDCLQAAMWVRDEFVRLQMIALLVLLALLNLWTATERGFLTQQAIRLDPPLVLELGVFLALLARFTCWTHQADRDRAPVLTRTQAQATAPRGLVYVLDDVPAAQTLVQDVLARAGHTVRGFATGGALLAALAERPPDLLLVDLVVGAESGVAIAQEVHQRYPAVPLYLLSGWITDSTEPELRELVAQAGAGGIVTKPIRRSHLEALVAETLRARPDIVRGQGGA